MDGRRISLEQEQELLERILTGQSTRQISREMRMARETIEARRTGRICPAAVERYWCKRCSYWVNLTPCPACIARILGKPHVFRDTDDDLRLELESKEMARAIVLRKAKIAKGETIPRVPKGGNPHTASANDLGLAPDINPL